MSRELLEAAYRSYWDHVEAIPVPRFGLHTHDLCDQVASVRWYCDRKDLVSGGLQEVTNLLNDWRRRLFQWGVWVDVLDGYGDEDASEIRHHFVEQIAFYCMFQPSAARDRVARMATESIHQANLTVDRSYVDRLDADDPNFRGKYLRRNIEGQLNRLGSRWTKASELLEALRRVDTEKYRQRTANWRNRASHSLAPRFEEGYVGMVERSIVPLTRSTEQADGTFRLEEVPGKSAVSYGWGGSPPMPLRETYLANLEQYEGMVQAHKAYEELILEFLRVLPKADGARAQ
jgi:hypothetical protein